MGSWYNNLKKRPSFMDDTKLNLQGQQFADALQRVRAQKDQAIARKHAHFGSDTIHVVGAGRTLTAAYEQLRNAAEYTEEHLLLQRAIRRFYKRLFLSRDEKRVSSCGEELVTELTLAGYLLNDTIEQEVADQISAVSASYFSAYQLLSRNYKQQPKVDDWVTAVLAVEVEGYFNDLSDRAVFIHFAYEYFKNSIDSKALALENQNNYDVALFIAVHRALLKSDHATIRHALLERYGRTPQNSESFAQTNQQIDDLLLSSDIDKLTRVVNRYGATLRVLWRMEQEQPEAMEYLHQPAKFLDAYRKQVESEYLQMNDRINRGVVKSVIFLIITKFLIGVGIEVPADYFLHGAILWLPLVINLFFPPLYMILLRLTLVLPGQANTEALVDRAEALLYSQKAVPIVVRTDTGRHTKTFNVLYVFFFVLVFGGVAWGLWQLGFTLVHLVIFFIFLSTASFLGFRLSRTIREIETVDAQQNGLSLIRDFLYLPFVVVGRWISEKYSRVNFVAMVLDMVIELPLKTVLNLVRQWGVFISSKKDEL